MNTRDPAEFYSELQSEVGRVLVGNTDVVEGLAIALLTRSHVLLEGVPGVAKTTVANLFARASGLDVNRIQMTPDILPADITGTHIYREATGEFELHRGPVFANVLIADEINRATPKSQSALLEAMQERSVTIEGDTLELPDPFLVVATQNPIEMVGTFELPEAQRDRFQQRLVMDLPERDEERQILDEFDEQPTLGPEVVEAITSPDELRSYRERLDDVYVAPPVKEYVLDLIAASRDHPDVRHGTSPRASLALLNASKARALLRDRSYVIPDDVKGLAHQVIAHRLILHTDAELSEATESDVVADLLERVDPPGSVSLDRHNGLDAGERVVEPME
ncbi:AAA family ATPase [Halomarina halobia]|uniref:AAA family ATPase n=1 Tax=Halomarina halobia TaxID=3033386 RepID=A0ABD6A7Z5_9EURY|nr:MoxR family ATPase [Halomarina sp. PSR21]